MLFISERSIQPKMNWRAVVRRRVGPFEASEARAEGSRGVAVLVCAVRQGAGERREGAARWIGARAHSD